MSDQTTNGFIPRAERKPGFEFWIYFAAIFLVALPFGVGFALWALATGKPGRGPVARAYAKAWEITPLIFSA
ncbi:MAG: cytochrome PufQ [Pseudomonadota bacterium]